MSTIIGLVSTFRLPLHAYANVRLRQCGKQSIFCRKAEEIAEGN